MIKLNINQRIFLIVIGSLLILLIAFRSISYFKEKKLIYSQEKVDEIINKKNIEITEKQKQIDSILIDLENYNKTIILLKSKIDFVNINNRNLEIELEKKKSEIAKMSNNEIIKYWQDEFKK